MGRKRQIGTPEGDEKQLAILDAAASVFMKLGFAATSLDDISDSYGATKGIIEEGVATGAFREMDVRIVVKALLGALNWTSRWYQPRKSETKKDRRAIAAEIARYAVNGLNH